MLAFVLGLTFMVVCPVLISQYLMFRRAGI